MLSLLGIDRHHVPASGFPVLIVLVVAADLGGGAYAGWVLGTMGDSCTATCETKGGCPTSTNFVSLADSTVELTGIMNELGQSCRTYEGTTDDSAPSLCEQER